MTSIITTLADIGIRCQLIDGRLNLTPSRLVTDEVKAMVKANREVIITALTQAETITALKQEQAKGYGCGRCGNKVYTAVTDGWQCDVCGMVFEVIGGTRGPRPLSEVMQ